MISHLLFDLGRTVIRLDWDGMLSRLRARSRRLEAVTLEMVGRHEELVAYETGTRTTEQFLEWLRRTLDYQGSPDQLAADYCSLLVEWPERLHMLQTLRDRFTVSVVSNTSELHIRWAEPRLPAMQLFHHRFYSFEMGVRKPDRAYFEKVLERLAIEPGQALVLDDLAENCAGAEALGIRAIVADPADDLMARVLAAV